MAPPLLRVVLFRALLFIAPFAVWLAWRAVAARTGRPMGSTPWTWLVAFGASLAALSLVADALLPHGMQHGRYVPAETRPDGTVKPGYFTER